MAKKVVETLIDDLDGGEAAETVRFGLDKTDYEIDLSKENAAALREALAPYVGAARKTTPGRRSRGARRATVAARTNGSETAIMREWAKAQGYKVSDRGRVPTEIADEYRKAQG